MSTLGNTLLTAASASAVLGSALFLFRRRPGSKTEEERIEKIEQFPLIIRDRIQQMYSSQLLSTKDFKEKAQILSELKEAISLCPYGDIRAKEFVKSNIRIWLEERHELTLEYVDSLLPFNEPDRMHKNVLTSVVFYHFKKKYGFRTVEAMIKKYNLDKLKTDINLPEEKWYEISEEDMRMMYESEDINLSLEDKISIIVQRTYQDVLGVGEIDEWRDQILDGVSMGISGIPSRVLNIDSSLTLADTVSEIEEYAGNMKQVDRDYDSLWIMYSGKSIHLSCITNGSEEELIRCVNRVYGYNSPGQLNQNRGYILNELADSSRLLAFRPKYAESWGFFQRKFNFTLTSISSLFHKYNGLEFYEETLYLMSRGALTQVVMGDQGTGKTTNVRVMLQYIPNTYNIRVQEDTFFEAHLRQLYPTRRNIMSFRVTDRIDMFEVASILKKSDGMVTIMPEIASDEQSAIALKSSGVASVMTLTTHHAPTVHRFMNDVGNAMVRIGMFIDKKDAIREIATSVNALIKLRNIHGERFPESISCISPTDEHFEYQINIDDKNTHIELYKEELKMTRNYYQNTTHPSLYKETKIMIMKDGTMTPNEPFPEFIINKMLISMSYEEDRLRLKSYMKKYFNKDINITEVF